MTDEWVRLLRIVVLTVGAVDIFFALILFALVAVGKMPIATYRRKVHVTSMILSYLALATLAWGVIAGRAVRGDPVTWYLPVALTAYGLNAYALWALTAKR